VARAEDYWHEDHELSNCVPLRDHQAPTHHLCYESLPEGKGRRFQIAIRDSSRLGEDEHHHALVTREEVKVTQGEYLDFRQPSAFALSGLQLIWASVVHGTPNEFDRGYVVLYLYDPARRRLKSLQTRLACPARCSSQFLSYQSDGSKVTLIHESRVNGQSLRNTFTLALAGGKGVIEEVERVKSETELSHGRSAPPAAPVCRRTEQVRKEIERRLNFKPCREITPSDLEQISFLALDDRRIDRLRSGDFSGMPNLNRIDLSKNPLTGLSAGLFDGLFKLRDLNFQGCRLREIPAGLFKELSSLKSLYLNHNKIERLHRLSFEGLSELTFLALNNNELRTLPEGVFAPLKGLKGERPYLSNNPLTKK
jgi:hypothetical protein